MPKKPPPPPRRPGGELASEAERTLVPCLLAPALTALVPAEAGGDGALRVADLCGLDLRPLDHRGLAVLRTLVRRTVQERLHRLPANVLDHRLPSPVDLRDVPLTARTRRCLPASTSASQVWTVGRYLDLPKFKASCLIDLLTALETDKRQHGRSGIPFRPTQMVGATPGGFPPASRDPRSLKQMVARVAGQLPMTESGVDALLGTWRVDEDCLSVPQLVACANAAGLAVPFRTVQHGGLAIVVAREDAAGVSACYAAAMRSVQSWGLASVKQIVQHVDALHRNSIDSRVARAVLSCLPLFSWLDQRTGWFWFRERPNRLVRALGKVFSVVRTIKVEDLLRAILRSYNFRQTPGKQVIESACAQLPGYRIDGDRVTMDRLLDPQEWLSPTELSLLGMLEQSGGAAPLSSISRLAGTWGISLTTLRLAIQRSPVVRMADSHLLLIA